MTTLSKSLTPKSPAPANRQPALTHQGATMNLQKAKYLIAISVGIIVVVSTVAITESRKTSQLLKNSVQEKPQSNDTLPLIISQVKGIEVTKATLKYPGTPDAAVVLELKNNSDIAIVAVSIETGKPEEANGITVDGFKDDNEIPSIIIKPHGSTTVDFPLSNIKLGDPLRISAIIYADDSEDGEKTALETIHSQREIHKSNTAKQKRGLSP